MLRLILLSVILFPFKLPAQVNVINRSLTDSSKKIVYTGVDNRLEITGLESFKTITITTNRGSLSKSGRLIYTLRTTSEYSFFITVIKDGLTVYYEKFNSEELSEPIARIGNIKDTIGTVDDILSNPVLSVDFPGSLYRDTCKVTEFEFRDDANDEPLRSTDNKLTEEQIKVLKKTKKKEDIIVENISAACGGSVIELKALRIKIR